jgi:hypothetical protein
VYLHSPDKTVSRLQQQQLQQQQLTAAGSASAATGATTAAAAVPFASGAGALKSLTPAGSHTDSAGGAVIAQAGSASSAAATAASLPLHAASLTRSASSSAGGEGSMAQLMAALLHPSHCPVSRVLAIYAHYQVRTSRIELSVKVCHSMRLLSLVGLVVHSLRCTSRAGAPSPGPAATANAAPQRSSGAVRDARRD